MTRPVTKTRPVVLPIRNQHLSSLLLHRTKARLVALPIRNQHLLSLLLHWTGWCVVALHTHYYMIMRKYICHTCEAENKKRNVEAAAEGKETHDNVRYTFMGWNRKTLKKMPFEQYNRFPAFLTHKAALDLGGFGPNKVSELLLENLISQLNLALTSALICTISRPSCNSFV